MDLEPTEGPFFHIGHSTADPGTLGSQRQRARGAEIQRFFRQRAEAFIGGFEQQFELGQALQSALQRAGIGHAAAKVTQLLLQRAERRLRWIIRTRGVGERETAQVPRDIR